MADKAKPKQFNIKLTDDERARLEAHRAALGLKSEVAVIRHWIAAPVDLAGGVKSMALERQAAGLPTYSSVIEDAIAEMAEHKPIKGQLEIDHEHRAHVQLGPTRAAAGSRLKTPKGTPK